MPYVVKKSGKGYKVFKKGSSKSFSKKPLSKSKAEAQQKALYASEAANESVQLNEERGDTLEYFKLWRYPNSNEYQAWFKLGSGKDILFSIVYKYTGEKLEDVDYVETRVADPGIPDIQIFEDPHSEEAKHILSQYGLTGDDIENAGQEGYEAIERYRPKNESMEKCEYAEKGCDCDGCDDCKANQKNVKESLEFEKLFELIMNSESEKNK